MIEKRYFLLNHGHDMYFSIVHTGFNQKSEDLLNTPLSIPRYCLFLITYLWNVLIPYHLRQIAHP